jgi:hypothetical protein
MIKLILITLIVFIMNIPFGYWRGHVRRFSLQWFMAIHIPVPFIIAIRIFSGIGFAWYTYLFLVGAFFFGQRFGSGLIRWVRERCPDESSCLVVDLYRCARK